MSRPPPTRPSPPRPSRSPLPFLESCHRSSSYSRLLTSSVHSELTDRIGRDCAGIAMQYWSPFEAGHTFIPVTVESKVDALWDDTDSESESGSGWPDCRSALLLSDELTVCHPDSSRAIRGAVSLDRPHDMPLMPATFLHQLAHAAVGWMESSSVSTFGRLSLSALAAAGIDPKQRIRQIAQYQEECEENTNDLNTDAAISTASTLSIAHPAQSQSQSQSPPSGAHYEGRHRYSKYGGRGYLHAMTDGHEGPKCTLCGRAARIVVQFRTLDFPLGYAESVACPSPRSVPPSSATPASPLASPAALSSDPLIDQMWQLFECPATFCRPAQPFGLMRIVDITTRAILFAALRHHACAAARHAQQAHQPTPNLSSFKAPIPERMIIGWAQRIDAPNEPIHTHAMSPPHSSATVTSTAASSPPLPATPVQPWSSDKFLGFPSVTPWSRPYDCDRCISESASVGFGVRPLDPRTFDALQQAASQEDPFRLEFIMQVGIGARDAHTRSNDTAAAPTPAALTPIPAIQIFQCRRHRDFFKVHWE